MAVISQPLIDKSCLLRIGGAFVAVFSLAISALILFAIPIGCTFVGSLQLLILSFLFVLGCIAFFIGIAASRKKKDF